MRDGKLGEDNLVAGVNCLITTRDVDIPEYKGVYADVGGTTVTQSSTYATDMHRISSSANKTITKQDYLRMTDKEKTRWIGIEADDFAA